MSDSEKAAERSAERGLQDRSRYPVLALTHLNVAHQKIKTLR